MTRKGSGKIEGNFFENFQKKENYSVRSAGGKKTLAKRCEESEES